MTDVPGAEGLGSFPLDGARPVGLLAALAAHPSLARPWLGFANELLGNGALSARWRELIVLRVAWRRGSRYVLRGHSYLALRHGVTRPEVLQIPDGAGAEWAPTEAFLLAATDQLLDQGRIEGETWAQLAPYLDERQRVELPMLVGQYVLVCMLVESLGIMPEPDLVDVIEVPGNAARNAIRSVAGISGEQHRDL